MVINTHQTLSLVKYWKLSPATLSGHGDLPFLFIYVFFLIKTVLSREHSEKVSENFIGNFSLRSHLNGQRANFVMMRLIISVLARSNRSGTKTNQNDKIVWVII